MEDPHHRHATKREQVTESPQEVLQVDAAAVASCHGHIEQFHRTPTISASPIATIASSPMLTRPLRTSSCRLGLNVLLVNE